MGLAIMIFGLAVFFGAHTLTTLRTSRAALIARIGEGPYKVVYSLVSLVGIVLIGYGFARYRADRHGSTSGIRRAGLRHVTNLLMWPAFICVAAAYIPGDIKRVLKHPMLVGVKLWALAHLISNGDLGSIDPVRLVPGLGGVRPHHAQAPHRSRRAADPGSAGAIDDTIAVVVGTLLYLALGFLFHPYVVGVPVFVR